MLSVPAKHFILSFKEHFTLSSRVALWFQAGVVLEMLSKCLVHALDKLPAPILYHSVKQGSTHSPSCNVQGSWKRQAVNLKSL